MEVPEHPELNVPRPWQPRFTLDRLMLLMLVVCFAATAGHFLVRAESSGTVADRAVLVVFTLVAPSAGLLVVALAYGLWHAWRRRR